jgi:hypothetical protein
MELNRSIEAGDFPVQPYLALGKAVDGAMPFLTLDKERKLDC